MFMNYIRTMNIFIFYGSNIVLSGKLRFKFLLTMVSRVQYVITYFEIVRVTIVGNGVQSS